MLQFFHISMIDTTQKTKKFKMEAVITEEKVPSDVENSFAKEKFTHDDEIKTDEMLDEVAARVDALDFNNIEDPEDARVTAKKQGEIIKKQAETINTLISQLRIMFDEYNDAVNEKGYYEDLSEALLRYIEICEGKVELDQEESETEGNSTPINQDDSEKMTEREEETTSNVVDEKNSAATGDTQASEATMQSGETAPAEEPTKNSTAEEMDGDEGEEEKVTISNSELIRLNHILLREIIELRNERDVLRSNIHEYLLSEEDDSTNDTATDEEDENHRCEHCTSSLITGEKNKDEEEYEHNDEGPETIENESDTE